MNLDFTTFDRALLRAILPNEVITASGHAADVAITIVPAVVVDSVTFANEGTGSLTVRHCSDVEVVPPGEQRLMRVGRASLEIAVEEVEVPVERAAPPDRVQMLSSSTIRQRIVPPTLVKPVLEAAPSGPNRRRMQP